MGITLARLIDGSGVRAERRGDAELSGIAYDSRAAVAGDLFCCIPGSRADGHDHAPGTAAAAFIVERFLDDPRPQARVERVRPVLGRLASAFFGRPSASMRVAGVTGTNGKTTVTYLLEAMAHAAGSRPGVIGTVSTRWGGVEQEATRTTPESVDLQRTLAAMRDDGCDLIAMEVTSDGLEQGRVQGISFACAGFTNLSQDHLITHGSMENYFRAKASLFDAGYAPVGIVNVDDPYGARLASAASIPVLTYGWSAADIVCERADLRPDGTTAVVRTPDGVLEIRLGLAGRHNVENLLCAAGMAAAAGMPTDAIVAGAAAVATIPGRLERVDAGGPYAVLVDYAHTPDALRHALRLARELVRAGKLIVVFGCGGDRDRAKRPLMGAEATREADLTVVTSDNPRSEDPLAIIREIEAGCEGDYHVEPDRRAAIAFAIEQARAGDVVLVAGKGHEQGQTFSDRTVPFDDRQVARELLGAIRA